MTDVDRCVYAERARRWFAAAQEHESRGESLQALGAYATAVECADWATDYQCGADDALDDMLLATDTARQQLLRRTTAGLPEVAP